MEIKTIDKPYVKAEVTDTNEKGVSVTSEFNCNSKREAAILIASLVAELCDSRADFNMLMTLCRKQLNYEKRQEMAARRGN